MEPEFWRERWRERRTAFHQPDVNGLLKQFWPEVVRRAHAEPTAEVFVPLCGKSHDMVWLAGETDDAPASNRHTVIGVELSDIAIRDFFAAAPLKPHADNLSTTERDGFDVSSAGRYELWCGDIFAFPEARLQNTKLAYDRASLIALPPDMRRRYARKLNELLPRYAQILLITIDYDPSAMDGPPFPVSDQEVHDLFGATRTVDRVHTTDEFPANDNLRGRGLSALKTSAFIIGPRAS